MGAGNQASRDTILKRCEAAAERVNKGFLDRYAFRVDGDLTTLRAEMAGVLAAMQKNYISVSAASGTDSQGVLTELERVRGRDSPPSLESTRYPDILEPILKLLQLRTESGSKTIFYEVRARHSVDLRSMRLRINKPTKDTHQMLGVEK